MEKPIKKVEPLDVSILNLWYAWRKFRKGKRRSAELEEFAYYLENNLFCLADELNDDLYRHGGYRVFYVMDNKKRRIAVASIYLNEFDQFVKNTLKPQGYVRYGDDFIVIAPTREAVDRIERVATVFLQGRLSLALHEKNNIIVRARHGLHFFGMRIYPTGRTLNKRNLARIKNRLTIRNIPSYSGLVRKHMKLKHIKAFQWEIMEKLENFDHAS